MLNRILPESINAVISARLNADKLYEIRLRAGKPVTINYGGAFVFLTKDGISKSPGRDVIYCDAKWVENAVLKAGEYSLYAVNNQIKQGFITLSGGIRLGLCGEQVTENGEIKTIKNFNSVNIRIPHEVKGCSLTAFGYIAGGGLSAVCNTLVISPPGAGKTTFLRDLAKNLSMLSPPVNVLLIDERCEIAATRNGRPQLDVGDFTDVLSNTTKAYGFESGIRAMRPDVIITDELAGTADIEAIYSAISCGVKVIASVHAFDNHDLDNKPGFSGLLKKRMFERYVLLSSRSGPGTYEGIYDVNFNCLYYP